jgi:hypothetical protein
VGDGYKGYCVQHEVVKRIVAIIASNDTNWLCFPILIGFLQLLAVEFQ